MWFDMCIYKVFSLSPFSLVPEKLQLDNFHNSGRFEATVENQAIFTVKERALEVLDLFFNFRFYIRLQVMPFIIVYLFAVSIILIMC